MRIGRIAIALATLAFGFMVAFQFSAVSTSAHNAGSTTQVAASVTGPDSGLPYD